MPQSVKIQPEKGASLCNSCDYGQIFERRNGKSFTTCSWYSGKLVPGDITKCSTFYAKGQTSRRDFEQIAWIVDHNKSGMIIGFKPPEVKKDDF